ncbi:UDP-3-O-(3-hydroxymyristoyl)glucosamine N-acyltransferase, partial [bacterium]|nr:UDP-3-O-(3-hydroxymyristoyl)glucosamine N-acyltransferase [bacterium]
LSFFIKSNNVQINDVFGICIVEEKNINLLPNNILKIPFDNPKLGFSKILNTYFKNNFKSKYTNIHSTAVVHDTAIIGENVFIGAYSFIDKGVVIDDNTYISERASIYYNCKIGKRSIIGSGVVIKCSMLEDDVIISPNSVIGKSGFGFIPNKSKTFLTPHVGGVKIGKGTMIGSVCTIDRGFLNDTVIGQFVMIDNHVHIAHNCIVENYCILAGKSALSGSVKLKQNVTLGGDVSIRDNVTIGENSIIAGASKVFNDFPDNSKIGGNPAQNMIDWKKLVISQKKQIKKGKFY